MDVNKQMLAALQGYENIVRIVLNGLKRDYEERGLMIRKEFHDELSAALGVACEAVYAAKAIAAAEQAQLAEPVAAVAAGWINPNDKSQKQFLPHIGEPVLFCNDGVTYYGIHTGGSFKTGHGVTARTFGTWDCLWMYLPAAAQKGGTT